MAKKKQKGTPRKKVKGKAKTLVLNLGSWRDWHNKPNQLYDAELHIPADAPAGKVLDVPDMITQAAMRVDKTVSRCRCRIKLTDAGQVEAAWAVDENEDDPDGGQ